MLGLEGKSGYGVCRILGHGGQDYYRELYRIAINHLLAYPLPI